MTHVAVAFLVAVALPSEAREVPSAREIAIHALDNTLFAASNARFEVTLEITKAGRAIGQRRVITKVRRTDDEVRSFVEFVAPSEVAGTKLLSIEAKGKQADLYLYLPAFKKVRRVVGAQRSASFMGTDFSYEDLEGREIDDASWVRRSDEEIDGAPCYVIDGTPRTEDFAYGRIVVWVHKERMLPVRIDFFSRGNSAHEKRLSIVKQELRAGRWIATEAVMATLDAGTETRLEMTKLEFGRVFTDEELSRQALER